MLRLDNENQKQPSLWESVLPPELFQMNEELTGVDKLLDDERFVAPFQTKFNIKIGRPSTAITTYLRMMYLKYRYQMGYEVLVKEVSDSFAWRRFCHLSLEEKVPESSTLINVNTGLNFPIFIGLIFPHLVFILISSSFLCVPSGDRCRRSPTAVYP